MILESFEIENWSCIKRVAVTDLPQTGIIVLHGPNGTGKSSIIEALRACLMDNKSTSKALGRGFPKNSSEKPRVSVTFSAAGTSWRITKLFNSKESKLESRTGTGQWKLDTSDPSEAHECARRLTGGNDSSLGLHQLLWLTQAEFRLPAPGKFDADVQSRLRAVLGVLQTPLDDRFFCRVKEEWSRCFGGRSKPGDKPKLKKDCTLEKALAILDTQKAELVAIESKYQAFEKMIEQSSNLDVLAREFRRQREEKTRARDLLQEEYERSLKPLEVHRQAVDHVSTAESVLANALALRQGRADAEQRIRDAGSAATAVSREVEEQSRVLCAAEEKLREVRGELRALGNARRELQESLNNVTDRRQILSLKEQRETARDKLRLVEQTIGEFEELKKQARENPAPDSGLLIQLEEIRATATKLQAELEAGAIAITLVLETGAAPTRLIIDGVPVVETGPSTDGAPIRCSVRRSAQLTIPGWGRAEMTRGSDNRSLNLIERNFTEVDRKFAAAIAPFGIAAGNPTALDQVRRLAAEKRLRDSEMERKQAEINRHAPQGLDNLRQDFTQLEKRVLSMELSPKPTTSCADLPSDAAELEKLGARFKQAIEINEAQINAAQQKIEELEREIEGGPIADPATDTKHPMAEKIKTITPGLRQQEATAKGRLATLNATAEVFRDALKSVLTSELIEQAIRDAEGALSTARGELEQSRLSETEETIRERLDAANDGLRALQGQLSMAEKEFHQIEGGLRLSEGLHQNRAAIAACVEELTHQTERDLLQSEAFDRLYALFDECREKQLGAVMGPIHDRVLRWIRLLRIGGYQSIRFNDQFLPEKLIAGGGAIELALGEESTGTIEQIGLMVRLALGSTLSTPTEPVVAVLDDPLTHSDVVRLDMMRAVLKNASAGDSFVTPPAGPMQILVFTCHPEWFAIDGAKIIDLSRLSP